MHNNQHLVYTVKNRCRVCYTCVRECPAKAIRIINGQAEIISERCIACGNCIKVCSQGAKVYRLHSDRLPALFAAGTNVIACLAPSFPAEFDDIPDYRMLLSMIRKLGFSHVVEVAFGADKVSDEYKKFLTAKNNHFCISSDCPAIVNYVRSYHPELIPLLMPVVSPMVAITRIVREKYGQESRVVFIGPCVAKKTESDELDAVLTFRELRELFTQYHIFPDENNRSGFDPPFARNGSLFPISRGLFQTIEMDEQKKEDYIVVAEGSNDFRELLNEFSKGAFTGKHLELLCCVACTMGAGMSPNGKRYARRMKIKEYHHERAKDFSIKTWQKDMASFSEVSMKQVFTPADRRMLLPGEEQITNVLISMNKYTEEDYLNCGACGYDTCREHAIAIIQGLAESEMCLPFTIEKLHNSINDLNRSHKELATAKEALKQSEKLASMGQLSAGIAHELNNPLGVITMYSNIVKDELSPEHPLYADLELIAEQAERCKKIVGGLLNFARKNQVRLVETDIKQLVERSISSIIKPDNVQIQFLSTIRNSNVMIDADQIMQVLINLEKNAIEAMPDGGTLTIELNDTVDEIIIKIKDTGIGIPEENMSKLFTPFFTTKKPGKGTGLGLPLIYGVVKMHRGKIQVLSNTDKQKGPSGTEFIISLPRQKNKMN